MAVGIGEAVLRMPALILECMRQHLRRRGSSGEVAGHKGTDAVSDRQQNFVSAVSDCCGILPRLTGMRMVKSWHGSTADLNQAPTSSAT